MYKFIKKINLKIYFRVINYKNQECGLELKKKKRHEKKLRRSDVKEYNFKILLVCLIMFFFLYLFVKIIFKLKKHNIFSIL